MQRATLRFFATDLVWALLGAAFFTYKAGYLFATIDHEELLPAVYRLLDPSLYPGDAFVDAAARVQPVRAAFTYTLVVAGQVMPLHMAALLLQVLCLVGTALLLMRIVRTLFPDAPWAPPLAPILALTYFGGWTVGGNAYADYMLLPHSFATLGGTAAALLFVRKKILAAGTVLGVAALYQPLLAGHLCWMLALVLVANGGPKRLQNAGIFCAAFLATVSPLIIAQWMRLAPELSPTQDALFAHRYFVYRHGLHYLPSTFPARDWWHFAGLVVVALLLLFRYRHPARIAFALFFGCGLAVMALYTVLVEGFGMLNVCAVQAFKASVWMGAAAAVVIAGYVGKGLSALIPFPPARVLVLLFPILATVYCTAVIADVRGLSSRGLGAAWYRTHDQAYDDLGRIHLYLRDSTPKSAVVLTAPMDESLMCEARRGTPVSHKGFLHDRAAFLRWDSLYRRIHALPYQDGERETADQSLRQAAIYDDLTSAHFDTVCRYDYRIVRTKAVPDTLMVIVRREGDWMLLKKNRF